MRINKNLFIVLGAILLSALLVTSCNLLNMATQGLPDVTINNPVTGSPVPIDHTVTVEVSAGDATGPGITQIDLLINDVVVDSYTSPSPQSSTTVNLSFTPAQEGAITVAAVAFRPDGTPSLPSTVALTVVGISVTPEAGTGTEPGGDATSDDTPQDSAADTPSVEARATVAVAIREAPGPGCPIIGEVREGDTAIFLRRTESAVDYWYETNYLGDDQLGWVYNEPFVLLGDDSALPRVPESGCLFCGDSVCSPEINEACNTCEPDCGPCCGNGVCEAGFGEDCGTCPNDCGACCGNGTCEAGRGEDCRTCQPDCGSCCGNGACETDLGEDCETCQSDCGTCGPVCGNGIIEYGEACDPPGGTCGTAFDGTCNSTCTACKIPLR